MTHPSEELLTAFRLGDAEVDEAAGVREHLGVCKECRASVEAIDLTLAAAARLPVPERSEGYGAEVWARLEPRLHAAPRGWRAAVQEWLVPRRLVLAGSMAVLVLAAFVAGRFWQRPVPVPPAVATNQAQPKPAGQGAPTEQVRREILLVAMGDHLERSQMALAELVNASGGPRIVDISNEQEWARDLVVENRLYRQTAAETGDSAMTSVLDDLERVLVEVANSPSELPKAEFERVRQRIESQGIIFKVRVLGERVRYGDTRPVADGRVQG